MLQDIWKKFRQRPSGKMTKKNQVVVLLLVGILLVIISIPTGRETKKETKGRELEKESYDGEDYRKQTEKRLKQILQKVEGAGNVEVMITYKSTAEQIVEKDVGTGEKTKEETTVYENDTDGAQSPYIKMERMPKVEGIVVVAEGGNHSVVVKNITEAVSALFDVDVHKIKIVKGG